MVWSGGLSGDISILGFIGWQWTTCLLEVIESIGPCPHTYPVSPSRFLLLFHVFVSFSLFTSTSVTISQYSMESSHHLVTVSNHLVYIVFHQTSDPCLKESIYYGSSRSTLSWYRHRCLLHCLRDDIRLFQHFQTPNYLTVDMSTYASSSTDDLIDNLKDPIVTLIEDPPETPSVFSGFLEWLINIIGALLAMIETLAHNYGNRLHRLEQQQFDNAPATATQAPSSVATPATTRAPTTNTNARPKRCTRCHARGHDVTDCRTTNPQTMRKRVAANARLAKQARANTAMPTMPAPAPSPVSWPYPPNPPYFSPVAYANLAADATELRRREAQSARDRRRRRPTTS
jgi:hypothetical protein